MSRIMIAISMLVAGLMLGCEAQTITPDVNERILLEGNTLAAHMRIVKQDSDRIQGDLLRVRTKIKNRTKDDLWVEIQVVWKDEKGYEIYKTNWAPFHLPARLVQTHEIASLRADVVDYELRVRRVARSVD